MIEFALVLPLLLALVLGIFEFGRAWNIRQVLTDAAREGARRAVIADVPAAEKPAIVSDVVSRRLQDAGLLTGALAPVYSPSCDGFVAPTGDMAPGAPPELFGCGWGEPQGGEARVILRAPYAYDVLRPVLRLLNVGSDLGTVTMNSNFVMRNE